MSNIHSRLLIPMLITALLWQTGDVRAFSLLEAYEAALENDPVFRAAIHENEAGQQEKDIGLAGLLPDLSITHNQSINRGTRNVENVDLVTNNNVVTKSDLDFNSKVSRLVLRQPILNMEAVANYRQGVARTNSSSARFAGHSQLLIVRLVEAYVETLLAQNQLKLFEAQRDTLEERKQVNEHMLQKGEGTITDVLETQSRYALAQADVIEANDEYEVARMQLAAIVGKNVLQLDHLSEEFQVQNIQLQANYDSLLELALERNAELVTQRHTVTSSKEQIRKDHAGHAPRVDLVASLNRNKAASFFNANQDARFASVGVEINIPLYAGGRVNAITRQAAANHSRAEADLDAITNGIRSELHRQYNLILSSVKRIESLELAVDSAQLLVEATQKSILGGVRINLDLLDAQQQLLSTQGELSNAKYNYLLAFLRLKLAAGTLILEDLQTIAAYFASYNK